ncbi:MAG TPA: YbhB/YbcL family Raf kinase inhibitor-like protein [Candidatus Binatia bacterium]|nr:YbhB/YbcL family Raf kinase inhibitor-like protein [Candidatus Binatia bacterium]
MSRLAACLFAFVLLLGAAPHFTLTSDDFSEASFGSAFVYDKNGCTGENKIPKLTWSGVPPKTLSFAIIVSDPDAYPATFYHWVRINIPKTVTQLPPADENVKDVGVDARNSFDAIGYAGPCPPRREAPHHYVFTIYALSVDKLVKVGPNSKPDAILNAMRGRVLGQADLTGRYGRGS